MSLAAPYPNPFNSAATIRYELPQPSHINLSIYDLSGRLVETLADGEVEAGEHEITWQAEGMAAGVYLVRMKEEGERMKEIRNRKLVLIR